MLKKNNLVILWDLTLKILKVYSQSKNPATVLWILEFVHMLSSKYNPKELYVDNTKIKKDLQQLCIDKL